MSFYVLVTCFITRRLFRYVWDTFESTSSVDCNSRLFEGTKKKLRVKRKTFDTDGKISREDKDLEISVKPGMKAGSKFKFKGVGDEIDGSKQDLHFIIEEVGIYFYLGKRCGYGF